MTNENGLTAADVAAVTGNRGFGGWGGGFGGYGDGGAFWIVILFLFAAMGGWGNNGGGWGNNNGGFYAAGVQRGFDQQAVMTQLGNVDNSIDTLAMAACQGFNSVNTNIADTKFTVAQESCATRQTISNGIRDVIDNQNQNVQKVLDKLCQLELDSFKQKVADQAAEIVALKNGISQTAQTAQLLQDNAQQTANLLQRLNPTPVPAYITQNPNCCTNPCGCNNGCGCN